MPGTIHRCVLYPRSVLPHTCLYGMRFLQQRIYVTGERVTIGCFGARDSGHRDGGAGRNIGGGLRGTRAVTARRRAVHRTDRDGRAPPFGSSSPSPSSPSPSRRTPRSPRAADERSCFRTRGRRRDSVRCAACWRNIQRPRTGKKKKRACLFFHPVAIGNDGSAPAAAADES